MGENRKKKKEKSDYKPHGVVDAKGEYVANIRRVRVGPIDQDENAIAVIA